MTTRELVDVMIVSVATRRSPDRPCYERITGKSGGLGIGRYFRPDELELIPAPL
jgi:hypothetical protein